MFGLDVLHNSLSLTLGVAHTQVISALSLHLSERLVRMFAVNNEEYEGSSKGSWATSPQRPSGAEARRAEGRRASTGSSASLTHSNSIKSKHHSKHPPHVQVRLLPFNVKNACL